MIVETRALANIHHSASVFAFCLEVCPTLLIHSLCSCEYWIFFFFFCVDGLKDIMLPFQRYSTVQRAVRNEKEELL